MKLFIKQKVFSWNDKFTIKDEFENDRFFVEGELFSFGHKLHVCTTAGEEVVYIQQKVMSFLPKYFINIGEKQLQLIKEFTFFKPSYHLDGMDWALEGDFMSHSYRLTDGGRTVMTLDKEWFTWGDSYVLDIERPEDELLCVGIVLAVDCVMSDAQRSSNAH